MNVKSKAGRPAEARAFTMIELLVVVAIIAILAGLLLPAVIGGIKRGDITQAQSEAKLLEAAMNAYVVDYHKFPGQAYSSGSGSGGGGDHTYTDYNLLIPTLQGTNLPGSIKDMLGVSGANWNNQNPRKKTYLTVSAKSIATNGAPNSGYQVPATKGDLSDPWGNRYVVVADWDMKGYIANADGEKVMRPVAVWSWGPDPSAVNVQSATNTSHIRSWR